MRAAWLPALAQSATRCSRKGFKNVRLETYAGTHLMDPAQIAAGLRWFAARGKK